MPDLLPSNQLHVVIKTRDRTLFEGEALAITSTNEKGVFDILGQHANFISLIKDSLTVHRIDNTREQFPVTSGVLKVHDNTVQIYLGIVASTLRS